MASYVRFYCLKVGNGLLILLQKKAKRKKGGRGLRVWNSQGYQRNSWNFLGILEKFVEFSVV